MHPSQSRARAEMIRLLGVDPYDHQSQAVARGMGLLEEHASYFLAHEMGTGKSLSTLALFGILFERGDARAMLVVCPSSVIGAWEAECARARMPIDVLPLVGPGAKREAALQRKLLERSVARPADLMPLVVILNYEMTWRMEASLKAARFDVIACDESQKIKAPGSKQSRAMHRIGKTARYRLNLTGTPTPESELDLYGQCRFVDDTMLGSNFTNFKSRFATEIDCGTFKKVIVNKYNLPELEEIVHSRWHRVTKEECLDLPGEVDVVRPFDLSAKARKVYDQLAKESLAILEDDFGKLGMVVADHVLTRLLRLQQITGGFVQQDDAPGPTFMDDSKLAVCREELGAALEAGSKVILWHRFTAEGDKLRELAAELVGSKARPIVQPSISGAVPTAERGEMVRRFEQDDDARVFVAQVQAASAGITLNAADTAIHYSSSFSSGEHQQARARNYRIGQKSKVRHVYLTARKTIDEHVLQALQMKKNLAERFVDIGWKRFLDGT